MSYRGAMYSFAAAHLVCNAVARNYVCAATDGYNAVIFSYIQMAGGKTFTPVCNRCVHVIVMYSDSFYSLVMTTNVESYHALLTFIRRTPAREYLLRCSYLEIYNEDLLAHSSAPAVQL
jgi:centromeric protein E